MKWQIFFRRFATRTANTYSIFFKERHIYTCWLRPFPHFGVQFVIPPFLPHSETDTYAFQFSFQIVFRFLVYCPGHKLNLKLSKSSKEILCMQIVSRVVKSIHSCILIRDNVPDWRALEKSLCACEDHQWACHGMKWKGRDLYLCTRTFSFQNLEQFVVLL